MNFYTPVNLMGKTCNQIEIAASFSKAVLTLAEAGGL